MFLCHGSLHINLVNPLQISFGARAMPIGHLGVLGTHTFNTNIQAHPRSKDNLFQLTSAAQSEDESDLDPADDAAP